jgi:PPP family 3-phenylpropionic acid transporter
LADALTVAAAGTSGRFAYGWIRGAGSAAFILSSVLSGRLIDQIGIGMIIWLNGALLALAALCSTGMPDLLQRKRGTSVTTASVPAPLWLPGFRRVTVVAGLIQGSHALHDSFAVIRWQAAGIGTQSISLLWSESVAAEVLVFVVLGRPLVNLLGPAGPSALAAIAGLVRWSVLVQTASVAAAALVEPLHGLSFALQHLASMQLIAATVPRPLASTAQALYGTVAIGLTTTLVTLGSGQLYGRFGAGGFWMMAALCAAALPLTPGLRVRA